MLDYPPEWPLRAGESRVTKELVCLENHVVNLFLKKIDAEVAKNVVTHNCLSLLIWLSIVPAF